MINKPHWNLPSQVYLILGVLLFLAILHLPYGFYIFLRLTIFGAAATLSYQNFQENSSKNFWPWIFLFIAILFNPFIPIYLHKEIWIFIDAILGVLFLCLSYATRKD